MHLGLGTLKVILLTLNQRDILHDSMFNELLLMHSFVNKAVSSAKRINWNNLLEL